jgi:hypothetical protein
MLRPFEMGYFNLPCPAVFWILQWASSEESFITFLGSLLRRYLEWGMKARDHRGRSSQAKLVVAMLVAFILAGHGMLLLSNDAQAAVEGDFVYVLEGSPSFARVTGYTGTGGAVVIPDALGGSPVTILDPYSFANNSAILSMTMPNTVDYLHFGAFMNC